MIGLHVSQNLQYVIDQSGRGSIQSLFCHCLLSMSWESDHVKNWISLTLTLGEANS